MPVLSLTYLHDTGSLEIDPHSTEPWTHQMFTFELASTGELFHFDINKLASMAAKNLQVKRKHYAVIPEQAAHILKHNGIEREHLHRPELTSKIDTPGLIVTWPGGEQVVVDGNHRYVARFMRGLTTMRFYEFTLAQARKSLVNVPGELGRMVARNYNL